MAGTFQKKIPFCFCMASLIALTGMTLCAWAGNYFFHP